ncbi:glycopeptide antibiotics resistance protein [Agromyces atrinae]|uniref:Glycopeptide antibiotics resistance protein n=2 Tax=Agromyces atrinae TaxID=592376 RepID=A0A4Q2M7K2_9MICO|nr:glycopeptide antibiotics resistance protein [Agromyces atrinae]RXZ85921.1 VanZ family protein [Agromyces atrinae]
MPARTAGRVIGLVDIVAGWAGAFGVPFDVAYPVLEFSANIALFVPFGILVALSIPRSRRRFGMTAALAFLSSCAIELIQLSIPTRVSTVSDVVANTLGGIIGALIIRVLTRRGAPTTVNPA